ncbi:MAG: hypothetical protein ACFCU1_12315 [Sumerlaeia bacterium]
MYHSPCGIQRKYAQSAQAIVVWADCYFYGSANIYNAAKGAAIKCRVYGR